MPLNALRALQAHTAVEVLPRSAVPVKQDTIAPP
jgi:hypothetical protein